jgi:hypothetical protein
VQGRKRPQPYGLEFICRFFRSVSNSAARAGFFVRGSVVYGKKKKDGNFSKKNSNFLLTGDQDESTMRRTLAVATSPR